MTHRLYDLSQMSREQLEEIASGLKIKSIKKLDDENLAYSILDAEANLAASQPDPVKSEPKKRGRKPKAEKAQEQPKPEEPKPEEPVKEEKPGISAEKTAEIQEKPAPKKRGRKPKAAVMPDADRASKTTDQVGGDYVISSTKIRRKLAGGEVKAAGEMLGYEYSLSGVVVSGNMMGRTIGFPTANMKLREPLKCLPGVGAYLSRVEVEGQQLWGMTNIDHNEKIETNIFDFSDEIYGLDLKVTFIDKLRDEIRFNSFEELKSQLEKDRVAARALIL